jgi:thymidine kinase
MSGIYRNNLGWVEVICGPMFSGKSEELIRRLRRAQIGKRRVQIFKPLLDQRFSEDYIVSHSEQRLPSEVIGNSKEVWERVDGRTEVIGIDEVQFLDACIVEVIGKLADMGKQVIVAGLDLDYLGNPFEPVPTLLAMAEYITKTLAVCVRCGNPANHTQRLIASEERIVVGAGGVYEARCRRCFEPHLKNDS